MRFMHVNVSLQHPSFIKVYAAPSTFASLHYRACACVFPLDARLLFAQRPAHDSARASSSQAPPNVQPPPFPYAPFLPSIFLRFCAASDESAVGCAQPPHRRRRRTAVHAGTQSACTTLMARVRVRAGAVRRPCGGRSSWPRRLPSRRPSGRRPPGVRRCTADAHGPVPASPPAARAEGAARMHRRPGSP